MRSILTVLIVLFAFNLGFAQKVKIKRGIAYVNGKEFVKVEKESGNMSIYSLDEDEDELIYVKWYDPTPSNNRNYDGYYIVRFIESGQEIEINETRKKIIKILFKNKVIKNGKIDKQKLEKFVNKYGTDSFRNRY